MNLIAFESTANYHFHYHFICQLLSQMMSLKCDKRGTVKQSLKR